MTKKILIVGITKNGMGATSGIMTEIMSKIPEDCELYFCGYEGKCGISKSKYNLSLPDPRYGIKWSAVCYRIQRKILYKLGKENFLLGVKSIYTHLQKYAYLNFDMVLGIAGLFGFMEAAYQFAHKNHIPFKLVYFDPFTNHSLAKNIYKREKVEHRWLAYADKVYYNLENLVPKHLQKLTKFVGFYIPFGPKKLTGWKQNDTLIYGGSFYKGIRDPELLYRFADSIKNSGVSIECYSSLKYCPKNVNIYFAPMLSRKQFEQKCLSARALIYIGNSDKNLKSSKYLEYMAWHKPIIGINIEPDNEVRKYKYYLDADDPELIEKLKRITPQELLAYNPLVDFPNRDPQKLADELFS